MKRNDMLKIVNPVLAVLLLNQICTALLHDLLPDEAFEILHGGGGITLAVFATIHIILNWNWIKANFFKKHPADKS
jgi:hypothetical protein